MCQANPKSPCSVGKNGSSFIRVRPGRFHIFYEYFAYFNPWTDKLEPFVDTLVFFACLHILCVFHEAGALEFDIFHPNTTFFTHVDVTWGYFWVQPTNCETACWVGWPFFMLLSIMRLLAWYWSRGGEATLDASKQVVKLHDHWDVIFHVTWRGEDGLKLVGEWGKFFGQSKTTWIWRD